MDVLYKRVDSLKELEQILVLQQANLKISLTEEERVKEGFLTVLHNLDLLDRMNKVCAHIVATHKDDVIGYALCMHPDFAEEIEELKPMFSKIDELLFSNKSYIVMGQICIARAFRKMGIFRGLYQAMREAVASDYLHIVTEVDEENQRSLKAHLKVGFEDVLVYRQEERLWHLLVWDLSQKE